MTQIRYNLSELAHERANASTTTPQLNIQVYFELVDLENVDVIYTQN